MIALARGIAFRWWALACILISWAVLGIMLVREPAPDVLPADPAASQLAGDHVWQQLDRLPAPAMLDGWAAGPDSAPLRPEVGHWVDPTRRAGLSEMREQAAAGALERVSELRSAGLSRSAHWYAMRVHHSPHAPEGSGPVSTERDRWLLLVGGSFIDDVRVWVEHRNGQLEYVQLGDHFLGAQRPLRARMHVAPFGLQPGEEAILWVRTQSSSLMTVTLALAHPDAFFAREARINALLGLLLGVLALAIVTYALLGVWLRDRVLLAYALLVSTQFLLFNGNTGMLMQMVREAPWWLNDLANGVGTLGTLCAASLLWIDILDMRKYHPRLAQLHVGAVVLVTALLPLTMTEYYHAVLKPAYQIAVWSSPLHLMLAWLIWRRLRDRLRLVYLLAFLIFTLGMGITVFTMTGSLPANQFTLNAYPLCSVVHTLVMAIGMALHLAKLREDKRVAEARAQDHRRFVALLTHEFRNPLASIDRSANFLQATEGALRESAQARIANVRRQVRRLNHLVTGFLHTDKPDERGMQPQAVMVDLGELCMALHATLDPDVQGRVHMEIAPGKHAASLDPTLMQMALENLLDNALRYSPADGRVLFTLAAAKASPSNAGHIDITITDSGPGLPEAEMANLGMPYYRGSSSLGTQGTGLGYYFSRSIIEAHAGRVFVRLGQACGLQVQVRLPLFGQQTGL